jgi:hypothetical protein
VVAFFLVEGLSIGALGTGRLCGWPGDGALIGWKVFRAGYRPTPWACRLRWPWPWE